VSKRLYSLSQWKCHSRRRQEKELGKVRRRSTLLKRQHLDRSEGYTIRHAKKKDRRAIASLHVPRVFSLIQNPEEVIQFLNRIEALSRAQHLSLKLEEVETLTPDAVAVLVATIKNELVDRGTRFQGDQPVAEKPRETLLESGFFDHVHSAQPITYKAKGRIQEKKSRKVEPQTARELIHLASRVLSGSPHKCPAAYRALIECMNNTHNHAAGDRSDRETWWAVVHADLERRRACYTFVDTGVGILKSVKIKGLLRIFRTLGWRDNSDILKKIFHGEIESSTGRSFRGKGLPAIFQLAKRQAIESLIVVTNDVYANVSTGEYRSMPVTFKGTLLYWEVRDEYQPAEILERG
jgi:hypothetical protein